MATRVRDDVEKKDIADSRYNVEADNTRSSVLVKVQY